LLDGLFETESFDTESLEMRSLEKGSLAGALGDAGVSYTAAGSRAKKGTHAAQYGLPRSMR
jgi:hypothetical protein